MASLERLRRDIENIASRPKAVTLAEITRIADQLGELGWSAKYRKGKDAWIFVIEGQVFTLSDHHRGSKHIKACYVESFLRAMLSLGLYEG